MEEWTIKSTHKLQWHNYNFCPSPGKHSLWALAHMIRVTLGPLYCFGPLGLPALPGLPMASYATDELEVGAVV